MAAAPAWRGMAAGRGVADGASGAVASRPPDLLEIPVDVDHHAGGALAHVVLDRALSSVQEEDGVVGTDLAGLEVQHAGECRWAGARIRPEVAAFAGGHDG